MRSTPKPPTRPSDLYQIIVEVTDGANDPDHTCISLDPLWSFRDDWPKSVYSNRGGFITPDLVHDAQRWAVGIMCRVGLHLLEDDPITDARYRHGCLGERCGLFVLSVLNTVRSVDPPHFEPCVSVDVPRSERRQWVDRVNNALAEAVTSDTATPKPWPDPERQHHPTAPAAPARKDATP
jgi:hypothetical protein